MANSVLPSRIPRKDRHRQGDRLVALVGNPNAGKTTLFNALTGNRRRVGNYPGTTVEKFRGRMRVGAGRPIVHVVDLPGTYSLAARSADEAVVLEELLGRRTGHIAPDTIVNVVDGTNLVRNLFLTTQLLELGIPVIVAINMTDLADAAGLKIDEAVLSRELGAPVVSIAATTGRGLDRLSELVLRQSELMPPRGTQCLPQSVIAEVDGLVARFHEPLRGHPVQAVRTAWLQSILNPGGYQEERQVAEHGRDVLDHLKGSRTRIVESGQTLVEVEARSRYPWIESVVARATVTQSVPKRSASERVDRILTHPIWGMAILLLLMTACFQALYTWAGPLMEAVDQSVRRLGETAAAWLPPGAIQSLFVNGVVAGVGSVFTFLPQICILFFFISIIEDCGYLARSAFLLDRWMHALGLSGMALIPLVSSFACAVPGIMATRVIESRRDRLVTILIAPLMSCSARLPVYVLLIGAFVPSTPLLGSLLNLRAVTLLAMYFLGVIVAVPVGWLLKQTLLRGEAQPFLMELPTYKWPSPRTVFFRVMDQAKAFCTSAGTIICAVSVIIWALGYYPRPATIALEHERLRAEAAAQETTMEAAAIQERLAELDRDEAGAYLRQSFLGRMGAWIEPVVMPLGWDWRIGTAVIASFPAREVVIATLGTLYNLGSDTSEPSESLQRKLAAATWPDGRPVYNLAVALSIMVFFSLCCQCAATLATIRRETQSWGWPTLTFVYMTLLAYGGAWLAYTLASRWA